MKKIFIHLIVLATLLVSVNAAWTFEVRITGDKLTVRADQVPLHSILERLIDLGIKIRTI